MKFTKLRKLLYKRKHLDLRANPFFSHLKNEDYEKLIEISKQKHIKKGDYFIKEGDTAHNLYYILEGKVEIIKSIGPRKREHVIALLESNDTVGEMALLDHQPRSASAKALTDVSLLNFDFKKLQILAKTSPALQQMLLYITESICSRMRQNNTTVVSALEKQLIEYRMRAGLGTFMVYNITALCLFSYFLSWISTRQGSVIASTVISLPLTLGFMLLFFSIMKNSNLPMSTFGLTTKNWRKALKESAFFTMLVCVLVELTKWILIHTTDKYSGLPIFSPYLSLNLSKTPGTWSHQTVWLIILVIYCLVICPLQELITRGGLQGPLEVFLTGKYSTLKAIVVSNLMLSTVHLFMGIQISFMVFFAGLYFGWLYSRHNTLIGVTFAHALLGTWATMIIGF